MRSPRPSDGFPFERTTAGWGVSVQFRSSSAALLASAVRALPAGFRPSRQNPPESLFEFRTTARLIEVVRDGLPLKLGPSRRLLRSYLESQLESLASTRSPDFAFLHAGCVEIDGQAILLPGRSGAGKSTLVAELLKTGARYLSDDLAPIDKGLRVHPFPRPIGLRSSVLGTTKRITARSLGAELGRRARPVALVWCGTYDPLAAIPTFERRTGGAAFAELLAHAPGAQIRPEVIVPIITGIARTVPLFVGSRGDAAEMAEALRRRLRQRD